jgi:polar amino acid transport system substrate-binding protein
MNYFFKILLSIIVPFCTVLFSDTQKEKTYNVAVFKNWMPYYTVDKNGKADGFAVDIFEEVAKDIGIKYQYTIINNFSEFWPLVKSGKIDIIPDIGVTKNRTENLLFSNSTSTFAITLYKREKSQELQTIEDFYNKTVAVVNKNVGISIMKNYPQIKTKLYYSRYDAFYALLSGEVDGLCYPRPLTNHSLKKLDLEDKIIPIKQNLHEIKRAMGVISSNKELIEKINQSIIQIQHNGKYDKIYQKWFGEEKHIELSYEQIIYIIVILVLTVAGCLSLMIFYSIRKNWLTTEKGLQKELDIRTVKLQEVNEKLKHLATIDHLTGVFNRRYFDDVSKQYLEIAKRNKQEMCVVSFDLDKFKSINDTYGHHFGDTVLIEFTKIVNSYMRKSDLFGRIGGEEFSAVLQNTSMHNSFIVAEKIRKKIESVSMEHEGVSVQFSVSIGIAELTTEDTVDELLDKSDLALYQAKENGRNTTVMYKENLKS